MKFLNTKSLTALLLLLFFSTIVLFAYSTGITGATRKNGQGCTCHNPNPSSAVVVTINGPLTMAPGSTSNFTVTISGGPLAAAGTNIAASSGTLVPQSGLQLIGSELTHLSPKAPVNGIVTYNFSYTAPAATGSVTLYANGNSVNLNGNNTGDQWNFAADKIITVTQANGVIDNSNITNYKLEQNFPNPFNPSTTISYSLAENSFVKISISDITGREINSLVNKYQEKGNHSLVFNSEGLASGIYFYKISANGFTDMKKMILIR